MGTLQPQTFAALLRRFRRAAGLTQAELAEHAGLSPEAISALERGVNRTPRRETVDLLAEALGLDAQDRVRFEQSARHRSAPLVPQPVALEPAHAGIPLVGRATELALIERLLSDRLPPTLLFEGEPGIGKTRLLHESVSLAAGTGWAVLMGSCPQSSYQDPYAPLLNMIERDIATRSPTDLKTALHGCGWLVRLLPELAERDTVQLPPWTLTPEQERRLMFAAVARYMANIAGTAGTLLVFDDLQWAGSDACDLLEALARGSTMAPLRMIGAYRNSEVSATSPLGQTMTHLEHEGLLHQHALSPLTEDESVALLGQVLPGGDTISKEVQTRVTQQCGGIPFYLVGWAQALASGTLPAGEDDTLPSDVMQSIRRRIAMQPEVASEAMQTLAVAGDKATLRLLRAVLLAGGRSEDEIVSALETCVRARLLDETSDDAYQFANTVIRDVVARDLSAARRTALHRRIAVALEDEPGETPAEMLAFHYLRGDEPVKAVTYLERAGDRAVTMQAYAAGETAYGELVERLEHLGRPLDAAHAREKWGKVLCAMARYDQALTDFEHAFEVYRKEADIESQARVLTQIGQVYADRGSAREGLQRLAPALTPEASQGIAPQTLAALHDVYAQLLHLAGRYSEQMTETEQAAAYARDAGDEALRCQIEMRRGNALRMLGQLREASQTLEDVIRAAEALGDPRILSQALDNVSVVYLLQGEFARSTHDVERALALAEQMADPLATELLLLRRGLNAYAAGDWPKAHRDYEQAQEMARQLGASWVSPYIALGPGLLRLAEGDPESASRMIEEGAALAEQTGDLQALRLAQAALAERDLLAGQPAVAHARLVPLLDRPGQQEGLVTYLLPYLAWASLDLGHEDEAAEQLEECLERSRREDIRLAEVDALRVRVIQATRRGEFAAAEQALADGLRLSRELPYPYAEAKLLYVGGLAARASGDHLLARERLLQARVGLQALGEGLYLPHVERVLASLP
ncbi:MAG TPA: AAA family ATPase [Ktedonobacterales bacterium]|jgi:transcriptional regulator with XRE-family HTH domain/tetratricopeptide (TPR) repeat protein